MSVEYDIVSDASREGYELGKGPWWEEGFAEACRSADPAGAVRAFLVANGWNNLDYVAEISREIAVFVAAHPDWRVVDDCTSDVYVVSDQEVEEMREEDAVLGLTVVDSDAYRKVGSRYRP